jgi:aspartate 1-decarboxylase
MLIHTLKCKIKELTVTESSILYPGSIAIPEEILLASGIREFEQVHVNNKTNGNRILTYALKSREKGFVSINGAASHLFNKGDLIHVISYCLTDASEGNSLPVLITANNQNEVVAVESYRDVLNPSK